MNTTPIIHVQHLFRPLDEMLISLLESLTSEDWEKQTVARLWNVKDVAAHLLDGNIRLLSIQRDRYSGESPPPINSYEDLVAWLNGLNADFVKASKRISPKVLTLLLKLTGPAASTYYETADLQQEAVFAVSWAGEDKSENWFHIAREYTEKWHHQQQIRDATGKEGILTTEFFYPCIDTFFRGLPHTFRDVSAAEGTTVCINVTTAAGGSWYLQKQSVNWTLINDVAAPIVAATLTLSPEIAWKLFSRSIRPHEIIDQVAITGDARLAAKALELVAVMA